MRIINEPSLWDTKKNSSEEDKELAWARLSTVFGVTQGRTVPARYSQGPFYMTQMTHVTQMTHA